MPHPNTITTEAWPKEALLDLPFWIQSTKTDKEECNSAYSSYTPSKTLWSHEMVRLFQCTGLLKPGILVHCAFLFFFNTAMAQWTHSAL